MKVFITIIVDAKIENGSQAVANLKSELDKVGDKVFQLLRQVAGQQKMTKPAILVEEV
jgi:hypothetical protein